MSAPTRTEKWEYPCAICGHKNAIYYKIPFDLSHYTRPLIPPPPENWIEYTHKEEHHYCCPAPNCQEKIPKGSKIHPPEDRPETGGI